MGVSFELICLGMRVKPALFFLMAWVCFCCLPLAAQELAATGCVSSDCHVAQLDGLVLHSPAEDDCESCHDGSAENHPKADGKEFSLIEEMPDLCISCHEAKNELSVIHAPVEDGDCTACHSPHSSALPSLLISEDGSDFCSTCHDLEVEGNIVSHGPFQSKQCMSCHDAHQSNISALLKKATPGLCLDCHVQKAQEFQSFTTLHAAVEDDCLGCHGPHNAPQADLLKSKEPELCFGCHDDVESDLQRTFVHQPLKERVKCLTCHSAHGSQHAALLEADPPKVCFDCHAETNGTGKFENPIENIQAKIANRIFVHLPVADGDCSVCHTAHGSDTYALLSMAFPMENYARGAIKSFALCFECHDTDLMEIPTGTTATGFRNGDQNLHYLHVNKEKGRSCKNCHDLHASDNPHLIAEEVPFGSWQMPLNFRRKDNGGSCLPGCHQEETYQR